MKDEIKAEINEYDLAEIGKLVTEGNTSGILDREIENEQGKVVGSQRISWELKTEAWVE